MKMHCLRDFLLTLWLICFVAVNPGANGQTANKRLVLKDGSYQVVRSYTVSGDRVRFFSAEREDWEEIPESLVDWKATEAWAKDHTPGVKAVSPAAEDARKIDEEEMQERAGQGTATPSVLPGLRLPDEDGVWALDTFRGQPELVELMQNTAGINQATGHNILRTAINPLGGLKKSVELADATSKIRLHVADPAFYVSLTSNQPGPEGSDILTVPTKGAGDKDSRNSESSPNSRYLIVRLKQDFRHNSRFLGRITVNFSGNSSQTEDDLPTVVTVLPGAQWMKVVSASPLTIGEYALMEILPSGEANLAVWDFRIDPQGPENKNAIMPLGHSGAGSDSAPQLVKKTP